MTAEDIIEWLKDHNGKLSFTRTRDGHTEILLETFVGESRFCHRMVLTRPEVVAVPAVVYVDDMQSRMQLAMRGGQIHDGRQEPREG